MKRLEDLEGLLASARAAPDEKPSAQSSRKRTGSSPTALHQTARNNMDAASAMAFNMAITQVREAVSRRRRVLAP